MTKRELKNISESATLFYVSLVDKKAYIIEEIVFSSVDKKNGIFIVADPIFRKGIRITYQLLFLTREDAITQTVKHVSASSIWILEERSTTIAQLQGMAESSRERIEIERQFHACLERLAKKLEKILNPHMQKFGKSISIENTKYRTS